MSKDIQTRSPDAPESADPKQETPRYGNAALTPPVDVVEDSGGITLYADLPGVSREKLNLHVEAETLTIEAESSLTVPDGLKTSHTEVGLEVPSRVHAQQGAGHGEGVGRAHARRVEAADSQSRACEAQADRR